MLTADDFYNQLCNLLPPGPAWDMGQSVMASQMLDAWAEELARVYSRALALVEEADPRTTLELLLDYERAFGLPTDCMAGIDQTLQQRRSALVSQMVSVGGQSKEYLIGLAAAVGYAVTITEFRPHTFMSGFDSPLYGLEFAHIWQVNGANTPAPQYFSFMSGFNEPLAVWGGNLLTCLFNRFKPAHTDIIFN